MPIQVSKVGDKMMCPTPLWVGVLRPGGKALSESKVSRGPVGRGQQPGAPLQSPLQDCPSWSSTIPELGGFWKALVTDGRKWEGPCWQAQAQRLEGPRGKEGCFRAACSQL